MLRIGIMIALAALLSACAQPREPPSAVPREPPSTVSAPSASSSATSPPPPWQAKLGQIVTLDGVADDAKLGAVLLIGGSRIIWIDELHAWPPSVRGKLVHVTGKLIERADLPVFVYRKDEPAIQGIPVEPGTDLDKASRRILLTEARWELVE